MVEIVVKKIATQANAKRVLSMLRCCALATLTACDSSDKQQGPALATVGDSTISQQQFDQYLSIKRVDKNREDVVEKHKQNFLEKEQTVAAIEKNALVDMDKIEAEMREMKKEMIIGRYFEKYLNKEVSPEAVAQYYSANSERFAQTKAKVAHILIRTKPNTSEQERQVKYTQAHEAYSKLKTGADFAELVAKYSEDDISKKKAGDLGWLSKGAISPGFSEVVFEKLKPGEFSEPVLTPFGYHIVKLVEGPSVIKQPLDKVKGDIRYQLRKEAKDAELARLKSTVDIKHHK